MGRYVGLKTFGSSEPVRAVLFEVGDSALDAFEGVAELAYGGVAFAAEPTAKQSSVVAVVKAHSASARRLPAALAQSRFLPGRLRGSAGDPQPILVLLVVRPLFGRQRLPVFSAILSVRLAYPIFVGCVVRSTFSVFGLFVGGVILPR